MDWRSWYKLYPKYNEMPTPTPTPPPPISATAECANWCIKSIYCSIATMLHVSCSQNSIPFIKWFQVLCILHGHELLCAVYAECLYCAVTIKRNSLKTWRYQSPGMRVSVRNNLNCVPLVWIVDTLLQKVWSSRTSLATLLTMVDEKDDNMYVTMCDTVHIPNEMHRIETVFC